jgi:hypothetical protein
MTNYLLGLSEAGLADYLVTGDKSGLLALDRHKGTRIITAKDFRRATHMTRTDVVDDPERDRVRAIQVALLGTRSMIRVEVRMARG